MRIIGIDAYIIPSEDAHQVISISWYNTPVHLKISYLNIKAMMIELLYQRKNTLCFTELQISYQATDEKKNVHYNLIKCSI